MIAFPFIDDLARFRCACRIDTNFNSGTERQIANGAGQELPIDACRYSGTREQVADHVCFDSERALIDFFAQVFHAKSLQGAC